MNIQALVERYGREPWHRQTGNLASTLARLSRRVADPRHDRLSIELVREAALIIEFSARRAPRERLLELAAAQRELLAFERVHPLDPVRSELAARARSLSDRMLQLMREAAGVAG